MSIRRFGIGLAFALAALIARPAAAADKGCELKKLAELPVTMYGMAPVVVAMIDGQPMQFVVDTGAFFSAVSPETADKLGHRIHYVRNLTIVGTTGEADAQKITARRFSLGSYKEDDLDFVLIGKERLPAGVAGLIGQNILGQNDVEFDLANGIMRLFKPANCGGAPLAYWAPRNSSAEIYPLSRLSERLEGDALVNGKKVHAVYDTGSGFSLISRRAADKVGVKVQGPGVRQSAAVSGAFGEARDAWVGLFDSVSIGDETVHRSHLQIGDVDPYAEIDLLIGADFFLSHRIYIARRQDKLYFTYNGGPVFHFDPAGGSHDPAATIADSEPAPTDAAGFARIGEASAARRDFVRAAEAFGQAEALDPSNPTLPLNRGLAEFWAKRYDAALVDIDKALAMRPDDMGALTARAEIRLAQHDDANARADFEAALKLATPADNLALSIATAYQDAGRYALAIDYDSRWIAAHPRDAALAGALNSRCRARAELGRDLDAALTDCDASLRLNRRSSTFESRALVNLRLGRFDQAIADYDSALKLQPKGAWSLYGRGLARLHKGQTADGQADLAAASILDPAIGDQAKAFGLTP